MGSSKIINRLPEHLKEVYGFLLSMKYSSQHLARLKPIEVRFIRARCNELYIKGFDELIEFLNFGIYYNEFGRARRIDDNNREINTN